MIGITLTRRVRHRVQDMDAIGGEAMMFSVVHQKSHKEALRCKGRRGTAGNGSMEASLGKRGNKQIRGGGDGD